MKPLDIASNEKALSIRYSGSIAMRRYVQLVRNCMASSYDILQRVEVSPIRSRIVVATFRTIRI